MRRTITALVVPLFIASALLFGAAPAAAGGGCFQPDTQGTGTSVTLSAMCFSPTLLYVQPGATVTWKNEDGMRHVVSGTFSSWGSPATLEAGQSATHPFPTAGIFAYSCPLHYGMNAVVIVGDGVNQVEHVVRLVRRRRDEVIERRILAIGRILGPGPRRIVQVVRRHE